MYMHPIRIFSMPVFKQHQTVSAAESVRPKSSSNISKDKNEFLT